MEETILYTKYALLSFSEYFRLNMLISKAEGFDILASTERYTTMSPKTAKINIQEDGSYDVALIFEVTAEVQRRYSELLAGIELIDTYMPIEGGVTELLVSGLTPEVIDWTLMQYVRVGAKEENMVLKVEPTLLNDLSETALTLLDGLGIKIEQL